VKSSRIVSLHYFLQVFNSPQAILWLLVLSFLASGVVIGQTPQPTPSPVPRTGKAYSSGSAVKPPSAPGPLGQSPVTFKDITAESKISFRRESSFTSFKYLLEAMGGGVAMFDYDNDGRLDLFFTNGARLKDQMSKSEMPDKADPKYWNRLYHQKKDGAFEDVTAAAGLQGKTYGMGVAAADFDNDGHVDLYVTGYGSNQLYHNNSDGTFTDVTNKLGVAAGGWSTSAAWIDYDNDGRLDLFVGRYVEWDFETGSIYCGDFRAGYRAYCHPDNFRGTTNILYRQRVDGSFEDVSTKAKISEPIGKALGVAIADFDNDGLPDIFVANDSVRQTLYHNKGDGTFEDIAVSSGAGYDENGKTFAGMGIDSGDYDNDGFMDVFITTLSNETYPLYHNEGDLTFTYATNSSAVGQITLLYSGWGARFIDVDNDGLRDLFVAQSHVLDTIEKTNAYLKYKQPPLLMLNTLKGFLNVSATAGRIFHTPLTGRGAAFGDMNNDGRIDVVIGTLQGIPVVLRNEGTKNHWLGLSLVGTKSNRNGIGARVTLTDTAGKKQIFDAGTSGSYLSSNDPRIVVGLGMATGVQSVKIRWPSGRVQLVKNPAIDQYVVISEADAR
jgi:hypothetical protein